MPIVPHNWHRSIIIDCKINKDSCRLVNEHTVAAVARWVHEVVHEGHLWQCYVSNLEHFCPLFKLPKWVSFCPDGLSFCPEYHPQFLFFTQLSHTPCLDMYVHKIHQSPPQNTPFPGLNLKVGKLQSGQFGPLLGKMFEKWAKLFQKWAKTNYSSYAIKDQLNS